VSVPETDLAKKLAYYLLKGVNKAVRDYQMIADGDRIAVAVSGGKDSWTLLRLLALRRASVPEKYQIVPIHVAMQASDGVYCTARETLRAQATSAMEDPAQPLEVVDIGAQPDCFRCSHQRRKALFVAAERLSCNKVALGHHADDAAQTTLLNLFYHGRVETLYPKRSFFDGRLMLIRPMIYLQEREIVRFAQACAFPPVSNRCLHNLTSRRSMVKDMIRTLEKEYPKVKINLFRAGLVDGQSRDVG
jgi:tRNA 2-thiocytidine biosynthesis protein TtcA